LKNRIQLSNVVEQKSNKFKNNIFCTVILVWETWSDLQHGGWYETVQSSSCANMW